MPQGLAFPAVISSMAMYPRSCLQVAVPPVAIRALCTIVITSTETHANHDDMLNIQECHVVPPE